MQAYLIVIIMTLIMVTCFSVGDHEIISFIVDVLPKLLLVHHSSRPESFAAVVLEYLHSSDDGGTESFSE
jgi:hypothetical protein